jgi:hypothetical protein
MGRRLLSVSAAMVATLIVGVLVSAVPGASAAPVGKPNAHKAEHGLSVSNDVSAPLRDIRPAHKTARHDHPDSPMPVPAGPSLADPVVQHSALASAAPSSSTFPGVGANGSAPSDSNGAVGPAYFYEVANTELAIYPKNGTSLGAAVTGPVPTNTLWSGFGGECQSDNDGDATVRYDGLADRWVVSQFALGPSGAGPFFQCVAVSTTADPTGTYYRYAFAFANFPDYPKLGVWPDGYYQTMNTFNAAGGFLGAETCAYDRAKMLNGQPAGLQCFVMNASLYGAFLPGDLDGVTAPPLGEPNTQLGLGADNTHLASLQFHVDWNNTNNTTLNEVDVPVAAYSGACNSGGTCIPQLGTSQQLDSLADRVMYRFAYRNLGTPSTPNEHWVATYSVNVNGGAAPRWWEFGSPTPGSGTLTVLQDSTYAPDGNSRWMGSAALDGSGDIALGYSESSTAMHPAIAFTGHQVASPADPLNSMEPETVMYPGAGSQTTGLSRWGDYSSMASDPSDGCTFWYTNQYIPADGTFNWQTRMGSFAFPACTRRSDSDFSMALFPAFATVTAPASGSASTTSTLTTATTAGSSQAISLTATPPTGSGITVTSAPGTASPGNPSTLTFTVGSGTAPGTYPVTVAGSGPLTPDQRTVTYWLTVAPPGINNGGFETGDLSFWTTTAGSASTISCSPHSGVYAVWLGGNNNCNPTATSGDSSISQTFTATQPSTLSFWYDTSCPDTLTYDWATATLTDNTAKTTTTVLPKTCTTYGGWVQVTTTIGPASVGHSLTLTLTNHDDNYPTDPTATKFDDVTLTPTTAGDFTIAAAPSSTSTTAGNTASYTVTIVPTGGFNNAVGLAVTGLPSGASATFNPSSVNSSSWTSALTIATTTKTPGGTYTFTITATSGTLSHSTTATLVVGSFNLSASPLSRSVRRGGATTYTVSISALGGFTGTESLTISGLPSGGTASFNPTQITNSGTSTLTITTSGTTATGTRTLSINATSGAITKTATVTLTITKH